MKKVLFVSNVVSHIHGFHIPYLKWFKENGYQVHVMANSDGRDKPIYCDVFHDVKIYRSPFNIKNIKALFEAKRIIKEEGYDIIHSHTPMGGVIGRLASTSARKKGTKVLYTAHGFHFYEGAPKINWFLYYTMEKFLAKKTDCIITINTEDFNLAKKNFLSQKTMVKKINGIGVDLQRFTPVDIEEKEKLKEQRGYKDKFILIYAAEFIPRKNHKFIINNVKELVRKCSDLKILFAGKGQLIDEMKALAEKCGVDDYIDFLGYCSNMPELFAMSDIVISTSIEEGFGINLVEGLAMGLPAVASIVRGHKEIVKNDYNGYLFDVDCNDEFIMHIEQLCHNKARYNELSKNAIESAKQFSIDNSLEQMSKIYDNYM